MHPECIPRGKPGSKHAEGCALVGAGWGSVLYPPLAGMPPALVSSIRWELFAKGLEDAEYFFQLDSALYQLRQRSLTSVQRVHVHGNDTGCIHRATGCINRRGAEATALAALDRVKAVVWSFPGSRNISDFKVDTYSTNVSLVHEVQDRVALALERMLNCV